MSITSSHVGRYLWTHYLAVQWYVNNLSGFYQRNSLSRSGWQSLYQIWISIISKYLSKIANTSDRQIRTPPITLQISALFSYVQEHFSKSFNKTKIKNSRVHSHVFKENWYFFLLLLILVLKDSK